MPMDNDWEFGLGPDCAIEITKFLEGRDSITVFSSDDQLLSTGFGTVDQETIMIAGNIDYFPFKQSSSLKMKCEQLVIRPEGPEVQGSILLTGDNDGL
jgi:hypothetical protein